MAETKKKEMGTGLFFEKLVKMVNRNDCFMLNLFQFLSLAFNLDG